MKRPFLYKLTIILPAYNEALNIEATCLEITKALKTFNFSFEILVVDDGSEDKTIENVIELQKKLKNLRFIQHTENQGLGAAYKTGVKNANGKFLIMIPADNAHPAEGLTPIFKKLGAADIILPYPSNPEARNIFRRIISKLFVSLFNFWFNLDIPYYNGLVLHKTALVRKASQQTNSFAYQAETLVKLVRSGASLISVPVKISERVTGKSSAFKWKNFVQIIKCFFYLTLEIKIKKNVYN